MKTLQRNRSVFQQTKILLWKNVLTKWRMKMQSFQEWVLSLLFLLLLFILFMFMLSFRYPEVPYSPLGQLDDPAYNAMGVTVAFTPSTTTTRHIMNRVALKSVMIGIKLEALDDERALEEAWISNNEIIGVIFKDNFSYHLRFPRWRVAIPNDNFGYIDNCYNFSSYCYSPRYWYKGFLSLQSSIDAAIIEVVTNHSVWEEMKSIAGVRMKSGRINSSITLEYSYFMIVVVMCFSPFMYFLSVNVVREKKKLKVLMKRMGLQDVAFWLSWSLLYAGYVMVLSCLLAALAVQAPFYLSSFPAVLLLFFLYGLACIHLILLLCSLLRTATLAGSMGFLITLLFGCLSLAVLIEKLPEPLQWFLSLFCPFAFNAGIAKVFHLEKYGMGFSFSNLMEESYFLFSTYIMLVFDSVLYLLLALYFDKVLPGKYGIPDPPFFCLKPSYWIRSRRGSTREMPRTAASPEELLGDDVEPVPHEFLGKKAIRINGVKKMYKKNDKKTEALRGLSLTIYEGQITALLGHSGAGKTTLLNVLSGLTLPSEGSATVYNYNLSERGDREEIRDMVGICPQFNIQFEALTVKENLKTFAEIKGIKSREAEREVQNILELLDISNLQDTRAEKLSGGQKRRLSIGIAMLGNPQVLFLDEPTAGLDPLSRHQVWSILKERRAGRVILFSTRSMDEADILADRKAFISHGRLKCVGSSLFLKKKWGIGYHLRIHASDSCDLENVTSLVKRYIPNVTFSGHGQNELRYKLPLENVNKFPDLFRGLDSCSDQGVISYGVSMTTLEDVFLRLEEETTADLEDEHIPGEEWTGLRCPQEPELGYLLLSDTGKATVDGWALWRQQVSAVAWVHFLKLKRSVKNLRSILLLYVVFLLPLLLPLSLVAVWKSLSAWELSSAQYFVPLGKRAVSETTSLLVYNNTGTGIEDFIHMLESQDLSVEITSEENITEELKHNGAIKVSRKGQSYRFTVLCHVEVVNCFPVLVNVISNALLRALNSTVHIRIWSHPFWFVNETSYWDSFISIYILYMLLLLPGFSPHFAMGYMQDYKAGAHAQLQISGLFPSAYWCGQALVDVPLCWFLLFSMFGVQFAMSNEISAIVDSLILLITGIFGYGISIVLFTYLISFIFRKGWNCDFWSFILIAVCLVSFIVNRVLDSTTNTTVLLCVLSFLIPVYPLLGVVMICQHNFIERIAFGETPRNDALIAVFAPYIHSVAFIFLLRYLETKYGRAVLRKDPVFRISPRRESSHQHPEELEEEDEDVKAERAAVRSAIVAPGQEEKSVIIVSNLCKEYKIKQAGSFFKKKKMAIRNVSFCVKKGEVLGLLGPNGAGKSTAIKMITGETTLTGGQVLMKRGDGATSHLQDPAPAFLGYCPQKDPLWPDLTVHEHLWVYAAMKGVCKEDTAAAVNRVVNALQLQDYLKEKTRKLSAGISRKLCFAMCMLGSPAVLLLDEPSTGLDPNGQHCVWKMIRAALKSKERGAILTTHYMEEAEAMCDRVAILVSGQLRCIGSIQYLKDKFGKGYLLEIKVKDPERTDLLHAEILRIFPSAARQERFRSLLVYKVPMEDALPLSQSFSKLEDAKRNFSLEEYSFSLNTLSQVVLELSREQENGNFDLTLDGTLEWKQLQQEDW